MKKVCAKNEVIFRQGDAADCMYEILGGSVGIYANYGKENEKLLTTLSEGNVFGEMGLIDGLSRSASAVALEDGAELSVVTMEGFSEYFSKSPEKAMAVMRHMSVRMRALTEDYLEACRTVAEMEEQADAGNRTPGLLARIEKYLNDYASRQVSAFGSDIEISKQIWS